MIDVYHATCYNLYKFKPINAMKRRVNDLAEATESLHPVKEGADAIVENGLGAAHRPLLVSRLGCDGSAHYSTRVSGLSLYLIRSVSVRCG